MSYFAFLDARFVWGLMIAFEGNGFVFGVIEENFKRMSGDRGVPVTAEPSMSSAA